MRTIGTQGEGWIAEAWKHLKAGGVLALPTETVYGLAACLNDPAGADQIFELKGRPQEKLLPLQMDSLARVQAWGFSFSPGAERLALAFWPGPLTLVLSRPPRCPPWFAPGGTTLAVRVPDHPVALRLLARAAAPLAVTSANLSGEPPCLDAQAVARAFPGAPLLVLDGGRAPGGLPSTVVAATGEEALVLREGPIGSARIREAWRGGP